MKLLLFVFLLLPTIVKAQDDVYGGSDPMVNYKKGNNTLILSGDIGSFQDLLVTILHAGHRIDFSNEKLGYITTSYHRNKNASRGFKLMFKYQEGKILVQLIRRGGINNQHLFYKDGSFLVEYAKKNNAEISTEKMNKLF